MYNSSLFVKLQNKNLLKNLYYLRNIDKKLEKKETSKYFLKPKEKIQSLKIYMSLYIWNKFRNSYFNRYFLLCGFLKFN